LGLGLEKEEDRVVRWRWWGFRTALTELECTRTHEKNRKIQAME
jgi:hypothetical protein